MREWLDKRFWPTVAVVLSSMELLLWGVMLKAPELYDYNALRTCLLSSSIGTKV